MPNSEKSTDNSPEFRNDLESVERLIDAIITAERVIYPRNNRGDYIPIVFFAPDFIANCFLTGDTENLYQIDIG